MKKLLLFLLVVFFQNACPVIIGSDTAVSRESAVLFPSADSDNEIRGFAWMDNGFTLSNVETTCTFNAVFPIKGNVGFNGGNLRLNEDIMFKSPSNITSVGNIYGNNHSIQFSSDISEFNFVGGGDSSKIVNLVDRKLLSGIVFDVDWSYDNKYIATGITNVNPGEELSVFYFDGSSLTLTASADIGYTVATAEWHPSQYYVAAGRYRTTGDDLQIYKLDVDDGTFVKTYGLDNPDDYILSLAWTPTGDYLAAGRYINVAERVVVYPFSTSTGQLDFANRIIANIQPQGRVYFSTMDWDCTGSYLAVGTTTAFSAPELLVYHFDGSSLTLTVSAEVGTSISEVEWSNSGSFMSIGLMGGTERLRIYNHDVSSGTLLEETSARVGVTASVWAADWKPDDSQILMGSYISTPGTEFRIYDFYDSTVTMSLANELGVSGNVYAAKWSHDGEFFARGDSLRYLSVFNLSSSFLFDNIRLIFDSDITARVPLSFQGDCSVNTRGNKILLENGASLSVKSSSTLSFENSKILVTNDNSISSIDETSRINFKDSEIELNSDLIFNDGVMSVDGCLDVIGSYTFFYHTSETLTIDVFSDLKLMDGATLSLSRASTIDKQPLAFVDGTSKFVLDNSTLHVSGSGMQLINGEVNIKGKSVFDIDSSDYTYGLSVGDGIEADDPILKLSPGAELSVPSGAITMNQISPDKVLFESGTSQYHLGNLVALNLVNPIDFSDGEILAYPETQFNFCDDTIMKFTDMKLIDKGTSEHVITGTALSLFEVILDKDDSINLLDGTLTYLMTVSQDGNKVFGTGRCNSNITLVDANSTLSWALHGKMDKFNVVPGYGTNLTLNGGTLVADSDLLFANDYIINDFGTVKLQDNNLILGRQDSTWTGTIYWDGNESLIKLNGDVSLSGIWTFSNDAIIDGNNFTLDLGSTGSIVVEKGSTLKFRNIKIDDLSGERISCLDDDSVLIFDNAKICLHGDYAFKTGSIQFYNETIIRNGHNVADEVWTFSYESNQTSTIFKNSELQLRRNISFEIGRWQENTISNRVEPLEFIDLTSFLHLNQCEFKVTDSGMTLKKGKILVSRASVLDISSTVSEDALSFGTGDAADDVYVEIGGDAELALNGGTAFYNNSEEDGIAFITEASGIRFGAQGNLTAQSTMLLKNGKLYIPAGGHMSVLSGAILKQDNMFHRHLAPYSEHLVKFERHFGQPYGVFHDGDYFMVSQGVSVLPLCFEQGTGRVGGSALISAPITLRDSNVTVNVALTAGLNSNIILNGGTIVLDNDLEFVGDNSITGSGTIALNERKFSFGTTEFNFTNTVLWDMSSEVELSSRLNLSGMWTFSGNGILHGHGNILDLSNGGTLLVDSGSTLDLVNIVIKGVGSGAGEGSIIFMDDNSTINMSNAVIQLASDYSTTIGGIYVNGPSELLMNNYTWTFDQNASLTVDGVTLWKDSLDKDTCGEIYFGSPEANYLTLLDSGTIKELGDGDALTMLPDWVKSTSNSVISLDDRFEFVHGVGDLIIDNQTGSMLYDIYISPHHQMSFTADVVLNGSTHFIHFSDSPDSILSVDANVSVTFENVVLKSLQEDRIQLGAGASIVFGDKCILEFTDQASLTRTWSFDGTVVVNGNNNPITFGVNGGFYGQANSILKIQNSSILGLQDNRISCEDATASVDIRNSNLILSGDYTFVQGSLDVYNDVVITGTEDAAFVYQSSEQSTIHSYATLLVDRNITFSYAPSVALKDRLVFEDASSTLHLNSCTLFSSNVGMELTNGRLIIEDKVTIQNNATIQSQSLVIKEPIEVDVLSGAIFDTVGGMIDYQ